MGNQTYYFKGKPVAYSVTVNDKEDGTTLDASNLYVTADYIDGDDKAAIPQGHQQAAAAVGGKSIMLSLDCKSCHKVDEKSIGPAFIEVAKKYKKDDKAPAYLISKIIKGGSGVWGETAMAAHPNLAEGDAKQIVQWILSLGNESVKKSLPANGTVSVKEVKEDKVLYISATYMDKGGDAIKPLAGYGGAVLKSSKLMFNDVKEMDKYAKVDYDGAKIMVAPKEQGWFRISDLDLQGVSGAELNIEWKDGPTNGYVFELRLGSPDGKKLGEVSLAPAANSKQTAAKLRINFETITDAQKQSLYIVSQPKDAGEKNQVGIHTLELLAK
jgi:cytochrome c